MEFFTSWIKVSTEKNGLQNENLDFVVIKFYRGLDA